MVSVKYTYTCIVCGKEKTVYRAEWQAAPKFCSNECKHKGMAGKERKRNDNWIEFKCLNCGKIQKKYRAPGRTSPLQFCNNACKVEYYRKDKNPNYRDGIRNQKGGYIAVHMPEHPAADKNGCVPEHRLVMEEHIGRLLEDGEVVHHINAKRHDNRIENLILCKSQGEHFKMHREIMEKMKNGRDNS